MQKLDSTALNQERKRIEMNIVFENFENKYRFDINFMKVNCYNLS